jgi:hypothetical protein
LLTRIVEVGLRRPADASAILIPSFQKEFSMATKKTSPRGREQDRRLVAGGEKHEVRYESKKTGASASEVKRAVKSVGNSRKKVEKHLSK